jgi:transcriptional regulator with XRE-family HTH domain
MRKTELSKRDTEICLRLAEARERLGKTQKECASQIGLERSTFLNYEYCRTPLRFEIALRFCRQFIISEEWLATGRFDAAHEQARRLGILRGAGTKQFDDIVLFRQCVDLLSEPAVLHLPPGALYSAVYDSTLGKLYRALISEFFHLPRICLSDADNPKLAVNLLTALNERFIALLSNEALRRKAKPSDAWRVYTRSMLECSDLVFRRMMRFKPHPEDTASRKWLAWIASDPNAVIPFIGEDEDQRKAEHRAIAVVA